MMITRQIFDQQRRPRVGNANPERMHLDFWEWMIRGDEMPPIEREGGLAERGWMMREGKLKSVYGPYRARDLFNVALNREEGPIWTFDRMGRTHTELPDGRLICIGGEHEDFYDPDFCIYNDVVVFRNTKEIEIYGYPKEVFPSTDFHTATQAGGRIIIVGCMGYINDRQPGQTPVYSLDLETYRISRIETTGQMPGWISKHRAKLDPEMGVVVSDGRIVEDCDGGQRIRRNFEDYALDIKSRQWRRLTDRNWRQFVIRKADARMFRMEEKDALWEESLMPRKTKHTVLVSQERKRTRFLVKRVPVSLTVGFHQIEIVVEGNLSYDLSLRVAEEIRENVEEILDASCVLEHI